MCCTPCAPYCMLFRAHYGTISQAHATPAHQRVATFRLLDVAALEHEFRFPIDLWRKSWTIGGWRLSVELCGAHWSHPLTSRSSRLCPSFHHPEWGLDSHNLGIGSETLGSCCSSQTPGHTCHRRFSFQLPLPATDTRALACGNQGRNDSCLLYTSPSPRDS